MGIFQLSKNSGVSLKPSLSAKVRLPLTEKIDIDKPEIVFLVWAPQSQRAESLSEALQASCYLFSYGFRRKLFSPIKYPMLLLKSFSLLKRKKPDIVICQMPPIFCAVSAVAYKLLINRKAEIVIDMHSGALEKPWSYMRLLNQTVMRIARAVIVSNFEAYKSVVSAGNVSCFILEDKIPKLAQSSHFNGDSKVVDREPKLKVVIPSSFAYDEPIREILQAASECSCTQFYFTGDCSRVRSEILAKKTSNVIFTNYLKKDKYIQLLSEADIIMALTKRDRTLLAGAYEAVALGKPLITSNWEPLKRYFSNGTIYVDNSPREIASAVRTVQERRIELEEEMSLLREERTKQWEAAFGRVKDAIMASPRSIEEYCDDNLRAA